jgi:RND family efflux transporter MFP subunit
MKMKSVLSIFFCLFFAVFIVSGCEKKEVLPPEERRINVSVQAAEKKSITPFIESIGTLNPYEEVIISAEVEGILREVRVDEGSSVSKGMVLSVIEDTDYRLEVKKAEAILRQAEATLKNTVLEHQRKETLYNEQLVTRQRFDDVTARLSIAEAELDRAKAALSMANQRLSKTIIHSPLSGVVKEKRASAGDYVRSGTNVFVIIREDLLKLNFTVPERDIGKIKTGQNVILSAAAFPEREFKGKVSVIHPSIDEKTRTLQIEALIPTPPNSNVLKPGMFVSVTLYTGLPKDAVVVPITSLLYEGELIKVFVVENNKAHERIVKVGQRYGELIEIIDGIGAGEMVVIRGQHNLFEGVKVNVAR